jgi:hypothetical protein
MKGFQRYLISLLVGFILGWGSQSVIGIKFRKFRNADFLEQSELILRSLRRELGAFKAKNGRAAKGPMELYVSGQLNPADPPRESLRMQSRWVNQWDGEGGFLYLTASGQIYLNADVSREKFFRSDWKKVLESDLFPPHAIQ